MSRPFGNKSKTYKMSPAVMAQRHSMVVSRRRKKKDGTVVKDTGRLHIITDATNCPTCEVRLVCPNMDESIEKGKSNMKCPLYSVYTNAVVDVIQSPIKYLGKTAGRLEVAISKQQMLDRQEGRPISPEVLKATELALKATKIANDAYKNMEKGTARKILSDRPVDKEVIDAGLFMNLEGDDTDGEEETRVEDNQDGDIQEAGEGTPTKREEGTEECSEGDSKEPNGSTE